MCTIGTCSKKILFKDIFGNGTDVIVDILKGLTKT